MADAHHIVAVWWPILWSFGSCVCNKQIIRQIRWGENTKREDINPFYSVFPKKSLLSIALSMESELLFRGIHRTLCLMMTPSRPSKQCLTHLRFTPNMSCRSHLIFGQAPSLFSSCLMTQPTYTELKAPPKINEPPPPADPPLRLLTLTGHFPEST